MNFDFCVFKVLQCTVKILRTNIILITKYFNIYLNIVKSFFSKSMISF